MHASPQECSYASVATGSYVLFTLLGMYGRTVESIDRGWMHARMSSD